MKHGHLRLRYWRPWRIYRHYSGSLTWRVVEVGPFVWSGQLTHTDAPTMKAQAQEIES